MTAITLCGPDHTEELIGLVARFHQECGIGSTDDSRRAAVLLLLEGSNFGAAWLFGPVRAPVGYMIATFSWSVALGGMEARLDEIYVRTSVRGRGIASDALRGLALALRGAGVRELHLQVDGQNAASWRLYRKAGFALNERAAQMSQRL